MQYIVAVSIQIKTGQPLNSWKNVSSQTSTVNLEKDDMSFQDGVTNMKMSELTEVPNFDLEVTKIYKLYYELPEGFEPTTYLNYVDYATKLEEVK